MKNNTPITILDGGFGRELKERGIPIHTTLWSAEVYYRQPELVQEIHEDYIKSGATIITTNTYAITPYNLENSGKLDDQSKLLDMAYAAAKAAKTTFPHAKIAASLPPLTESFRPDLVNQQRMDTEYKVLIDHALKNHPDILLGETLSSLAEVKTLSSLTQGVDIPVWLSFTVGQDGHLRSGESVIDAANTALDAGASAILLNCSDVIEVTQGLKHLQALSKQRAFTYGAYANRFVTINKDFTLTSEPLTMNEDLTPERYLEYATQWIELGATIIGGCCGIGPKYIQKLAKFYSLKNEYFFLE